VFEKQACQLAMVNIADINSGNDSVCSDIVLVVVKNMSTTFLNQTYIHKIRQKHIKNTAIQKS
jgi:hypothetical protein